MAPGLTRDDPELSDRTIAPSLRWAIGGVFPPSLRDAYKGGAASGDRRSDTSDAATIRWCDSRGSAGNRRRELQRHPSGAVEPPLLTLPLPGEIGAEGHVELGVNSVSPMEGACPTRGSATPASG